MKNCFKICFFKSSPFYIIEQTKDQTLELYMLINMLHSHNVTWIFLPYCLSRINKGCRDRLDLQLPVHSVSIATSIVNSYLRTLFMAWCTWYTMHYVIKFVSDLRQVGGCHLIFWFSPPIKLKSRYNWNIVESGVKHKKPNKT